MNLIQQELGRLGHALYADPRPEREAELYAAQQALAWVLDPRVTMAPYDHVVTHGIAAVDTDYSGHTHPETS